MTAVQKEVPWGSDQHKKIVDELWGRMEFSQRHMSKRYDKWRRAEDQFQLYRPEKEQDADRRRRRDSGDTTFVTLQVPYSYATLLTAHTYFSTVFLSRNPIFQFQGRHGEAESSTTALESLIEYQVTVGEMQPIISIWLMDAGKFGLGVTGDYWEENYSTVTEYVEQPTTFLGMPVPGGKTKKVRNTSRQLIYKGNKIYNVRPYDWLPDPRVAVKDFQKGEFCGRLVNISMNEVTRRMTKGQYFNQDALDKNLNGARDYQSAHNQGSPRVDLPAGEGANSSETAGSEYAKSIKQFIRALEMTVELIPQEWGLHPGTDPEKWVFTLANDAVLIGCQPLGCYHNKFPFNVLEYEIDGYAQSKRGMLEVTSDLNEILTWLFNSRMHNVRKMINGMMVVDPSKIVMKDLTKEGTAKLIRMKPTAYGQEVKNFLQQVPVQDVTQSHVKDAEIVSAFIQRVTGVTENIMGMVNAGGRKTATEVRTSSSFGVNRLKTLCEYFSSIGFGPMAQKFVQNTQQYYDLEEDFRIAGQSVLQSGYLKVTPEMIAGFYDFIPVDGTLPIDKFALASIWKEVILGAVQIPQLAARYDIPGMFGWAAELMGLKNIKQFEIQVQPDQAMAAQAQAGNVVPLRPGVTNVSNLNTAAQNGAAPGTQTGAQGAPVISGMGPVG